MIRLGTRSWMGAAILTSVLVACQPAVPSPSPTGTSVAVTPAPTAATVASAQPTQAPTSTPSGACPSPLPTDISDWLEMHEVCAADTELTIEGWLAYGNVGVETGETAPSWTMSMSSLYENRPTVRQYVFDFLLAGPYGLRLVTRPDSGVDLSGDGRWVRLRGHFNDPEVLACTFVDPELAADPETNNECNQLFVVEGLEDAPLPAPDCQTATPLSMTTFFDAPAVCFVGREVQLIGWEDVGEGFGGVSTAYPLDLGSLGLAHAQLVSERWELDGDREVIFPWLVGGAGVAFDRSDKRVIVTGRVGHPAAEGCRPGAVGWTWTPSIAWAQERCRHLFVITGVEPR